MSSIADDTTFVSLSRRARHALRLRGPLADNPIAGILHSLLVGSLLWEALYILTFLPFDPRVMASSVRALFLALVWGGALFLVRRGALRTASLVYLSGTWLATSVTIVLNGGIHSVGLVFYVPFPILVACLFGFRASLWSAAFCMACVVVLALLEHNGHALPFFFPGVPFALCLGTLLAIVMATVPTARVLQILEAALVQARSAEESMKEHQKHLEHLVQQRTAALADARDEAWAANKAKSIFLATMSHELRTPLNVIVGFSTLVRDTDRGISEEHRADLDRVHHSAQNLLELIDELLDIGKIEVGRVVVNKAPFALHKLLSGIMDMMRMRAHENNLELILELSSAVPRFAQSDADKLRRILINLLDNAVKYTESGRITLRVDARPVNEPKRLMLTLEVLDTGIGISPEDQARIFDPFVQVGKAAVRKAGGLGLSITRKLVELIEGTITIDSRLGLGSSFHVDVPVEPAEEFQVKSLENDGSRIPVLAPGQTEYRVLIVEDDRQSALLLERILQGAGFQVLVAEDGERGVGTFLTWRPHLIWIDLQRLVMPGLDAARRIRELDGGREVKIAAVTAYPYDKQREEALDAGVDDFIRKPYSREEIFDCMARLLGVQYQYRQAAWAPSENSASPLRPEALAAIPQELREELVDALVRLDTTRIAAVIVRVSERNALLGHSLAHYADRFAYSQILHALASPKEEKRETGLGEAN